MQEIAFSDLIFQNFFGGACPRNPLDVIAPSALVCPPYFFNPGDATGVNCHKGKTFIETVHMRHPDNIGDMIVQMGFWQACLLYLGCHVNAISKNYINNM